MTSNLITIRYSDITFTIPEDETASRSILDRLRTFFECLNLNITESERGFVIGLLLERPISRLVGPDEISGNNLNFVSDKILRHVLILIKNTLSPGRYDLVTEHNKVGTIKTYIYDNALEEVVPILNLEDHLGDLYTHELETLSVLDDRLHLLEFIRLGNKLYKLTNQSPTAKVMKDVSKEVLYNFVKNDRDYITSFSYKGTTLATNFTQLLNDDKALVLNLGAILTKQ